MAQDIIEKNKEINPASEPNGSFVISLGARTSWPFISVRTSWTFETVTTSLTLHLLGRPGRLRLLGFLDFTHL